VQELQGSLLILQAEVDDLSSAVRELEDKSSSE
jgi:hypothetical protein